MILDLKSAFLFFCFQNKELLYQKLKGGPKRRKRVYYFLVVFLLFLCGIVSEKSQNWALCTELNPWWELSQESHFEFLLNLIRCMQLIDMFISLCTNSFMLVSTECQPIFIGPEVGQCRCQKISSSLLRGRGGRRTFCPRCQQIHNLNSCNTHCNITTYCQIKGFNNLSILVNSQWVFVCVL